MIVYYTNLPNLFVHDPEPLISSILTEKENKHIQLIKMCPALKESCKNIFVFKNIINYDLQWNFTGEFNSFSRDRGFLNDWVYTRSNQDGIVSYCYPGYLFFSEKSLDMEVLPPYLHNCDISKKTLMITGKYNIGKHARRIENAMIFRNRGDKVEFVENTPQFYVKFHTEEKIQFKKFFMTAELLEISNNILSLRDFLNGKKPLQYWYDIFTLNYRKKFLKIIKQNLL
jgi:hypothetical protein